MNNQVIQCVKFEALTAVFLGIAVVVVCDAVSLGKWFLMFQCSIVHFSRV